jgi:hypothetical protein
MNEKIFISICAFNEKDLGQTVLSAIHNAVNPNRLFFGIFECSSHGNFTNFENNNKNIYHLKATYNAPFGVGLPRLNSSMLNDREYDFYLQVDAHMLFENNWDTDLIDSYNLISKNHKKVIISTYTPWWYHNEKNEIVLSTNNQVIEDVKNFSTNNLFFSHALRMENKEEGLVRNYIDITSKSVEWNDQKIYEEHFCLSGNFLFSDSFFVKEVMHDPLISWGGDQSVMALRSFTRGYRIFTIKKPIVWHKNKCGEFLDKNDWRYNYTIYDKTLYSVYLKSVLPSYRRIKDIFLGDYFGYWGAPNKELLDEYEAAVGSNFKDYYDSLKELLINEKNIRSLKALYE